MTSAVFLDRDGVINRKPLEGDYVTSWADFHILPGVAEAVALLNRAGFGVIVVTNQRCIAKGLISAAGVEDLHRNMTDFLASAGARIDGIYYCPHEIGSACDCRKPAPGMLLDAARMRGIDLTASWTIGDSDVDIEAGRNAACKTARLLARNDSVDGTAPTSESSAGADITATSLLDAVRRILFQEGLAATASAKVSASI